MSLLLSEETSLEQCRGVGAALLPPAVLPRCPQVPVALQVLPAARPVGGEGGRITLFLLFSSSREKTQAPHAWLFPTGLSLFPQGRWAPTTYTVKHLQEKKNKLP